MQNVFPQCGHHLGKDEKLSATYFAICYAWELEKKFILVCQSILTREWRREMETDGLWTCFLWPFNPPGISTVDTSCTSSFSLVCPPMTADRSSWLRLSYFLWFPWEFNNLPWIPSCITLTSSFHTIYYNDMYKLSFHVTNCAQYFIIAMVFLSVRLLLYSIIWTWFVFAISMIYITRDRWQALLCVKNAVKIKCTQLIHKLCFFFLNLCLVPVVAHTILKNPL